MSSDVATTCCSPPSSTRAEQVGRQALRSGLSPDPRFRSPPSTSGAAPYRAHARDDRAEKVPALGCRDLPLGVGQVRGADGDGRGGGDVQTQPCPLLGVFPVLGGVDPSAGGGPGHRRPPRDDADAVLLAVAAAVGVLGTPVACRLERGHGRVAGHDIGERTLEGRHVVLADLVQGDQVGCLGADHRGGLGRRPAGMAGGDATAAQVQLQYPRRRGRRATGRGRRSRRGSGRVQSGRCRGALDQAGDQAADNRCPWSSIRSVGHSPLHPRGLSPGSSDPTVSDRAELHVVPKPPGVPRRSSSPHHRIEESRP